MVAPTTSFLPWRARPCSAPCHPGTGLPIQPHDLSGRITHDASPYRLHTCCSRMAPRWCALEARDADSGGDVADRCLEPDRSHLQVKGACDVRSSDPRPGERPGTGARRAQPMVTAAGGRCTRLAGIDRRGPTTDGS